MSSIVGIAGLASIDTDPLWERQNRAAGESDCVVTTGCGVFTGALAPHGIVQLASKRSEATISDIRIVEKVINKVALKHLTSIIRSNLKSKYAHPGRILTPHTLN
jgi:hypothetical protein